MMVVVRQANIFTTDILLIENVFLIESPKVKKKHTKYIATLNGNIS